ncbi:MAG: ArsR/SmtB family transcription factor [Candidatus Hodarchaeota archaeon]
MPSDILVKAKFFRGLADPTRLSVLNALLDSEKSVGETVKLTQKSQSNVSNHLKCLYECGLVKKRREGKKVLYSIRHQDTKKLLQLSEKILLDVYSQIAACIKYGGKDNEDSST